MHLTKTDYLIYYECGKNAWVKIHKPDIYFSCPPSQFDLALLEMGNDVDALARDLFPGGVLVESRDDVEYTMRLVGDRTPVIYQPVFENETFKTASDILVWNDVGGGYDIYEVKASNNGEDKNSNDKIYLHDLAFQYVLLKALSIPINKLYLVRLNHEYVRGGALNLEQLFTKEDFTTRVFDIIDHVKDDMNRAYDFLSQNTEPFGSCTCIIKGRSAHCTTFFHSNPNIPTYSVHEIARIGSSKQKLQELVDGGILSIHDVPEDFELTAIQRKQVDAAQKQTSFIDHNAIRDFLGAIEYPISFLDYETYPAAIPRFMGYHPFDQIPFQFSLHTLESVDEECDHSEFIFVKENQNPDMPFITALQNLLPEKGSIIVWNKRFEMGINSKLGERNSEFASFLEGVNVRVIDLEEVFKKQYFVHPGFKGRTSIKSVLPVLAPNLSYKELDIQEGATASDTWNKIVSGGYSNDESLRKVENLKTYCALDTYAMYAIWKYLKTM